MQMMNDCLHEDIHSLFYLVVIWCIRWPGIGGLNLKVLWGWLYWTVFVSVEGFKILLRSVLEWGLWCCAQESGIMSHPGVVSGRRRCESSAGWAFSLPAGCRPLLWPEPLRGTLAGVGALGVCAFQTPKATCWCSDVHLTEWTEVNVRRTLWVAKSRFPSLYPEMCWQSKRVLVELILLINEDVKSSLQLVY